MPCNANKLILDVSRDFIADIVDDAQSAADTIINLSSQFLSEDAKKATEDFQRLYFADLQTENLKQDINREVDHLLDSYRQDPHELPQLSSEVEQLAALQKRLEKIIRDDDALRMELTPVIAAMQFAEILRHTLAHLHEVWRINSNDSIATEAKTLEMLNALFRPEERQAFCEWVIRSPEKAAIEKYQPDWIEQLMESART